MSEGQIFGAACVSLCAFTCWYCYTLGWWRGKTEGILWSTKQVFGE